MIHHCVCCPVTGAEVCYCVITTCGECSHCRTHCLCFSEAMRELMEDLDDPGGPFGSAVKPALTSASPPQ